MIAWFDWWEMTPDLAQVGGVTARLRLWQICCKQSDFLHLYQKQCSGSCEEEWDGSCQDTMTFTSYPGYTRLPKTNCPVKFLNALFTSKGHRETEVAWMLHSLRGGLCFSGSQRYSAPGARLLIWKNRWHRLLKGARPGQLHDFPTQDENRKKAI